MRLLISQSLGTQDDMLHFKQPHAPHAFLKICCQQILVLLKPKIKRVSEQSVRRRAARNVVHRPKFAVFGTDLQASRLTPQATRDRYIKRTFQ